MKILFRELIFQTISKLHPLANMIYLLKLDVPAVHLSICHSTGNVKEPRSGNAQYDRRFSLQTKVQCLYLIGHLDDRKSRSNMGI